MVELAEFKSLDTIGMNCFLFDNPKLAQIGLEALQYVGGLIGLEDCLVEEITFFDQLNFAEAILLTNFPNLTSLNGLQNITNIENVNFDLSLINCPKVPDLSPLTQWDVGYFDLHLENNTQLSDVSDLKLKDRGKIVIINSPLLPKIEFPMFKEGEVAVNNCALVSRIAFDSLDSPEWFTVANCPSLVDLYLPKYGVLEKGPDYLDAFEGFALVNCDALKEINLPEVGYKTRSIFIDSCASLESIKIPNMVRSYITDIPFQIGHSVSFKFLPKLTELSIPKLRIVGDLLDIESTGLEKIHIDSLERSDLRIRNNPNLDSILMLNNLQKSRNIHFWIQDTKYAEPFTHLDSISNRLTIVNTFFNDTTKKMNFPRLKVVSSLSMSNHDSILHAALSFPNLEFLNNLYVSNNDSLQNINIVANVRSIQNSINIKNNPNLTDCSAICDILSYGNTDPGIIELEDNPLECLTLDAILTYCDTLTSSSTEVVIGETSFQLLTENPIQSGENLNVIVQSNSYQMNGELMVYDGLGRRKYFSRLSGIGSVSIPTANWSQGVYFLVCRLGDKVQTKKILVY